MKKCFVIQKKIKTKNIIRNITRNSIGDIINQFKTLKEVKISETISKITIPFATNLPEVLYFRSFYADLLEDIIKYERVVLLGNPGVGKSLFQFFYLYRLATGNIGPNVYGNIPDTVIRQVRANSFSIYDFKTEKTEEFLLGGFPKTKIPDQQKSIYLFEPEVFKIEPYIGGLYIPTISTVSPDQRRYKEFCKNGGVQFFMPLWTLEDLLVVGKDMRENVKFPTELQDLYKDEKIKERFVF
jgi:hypothetical protein